MQAYIIRLSINKGIKLGKRKGYKIGSKLKLYM